MYTYMVSLHPRGDSVTHAMQAAEEGQIISYLRRKSVIQWSHERIDNECKNTSYFWLYLYPRRTAHALFFDPKKITELFSELVTVILFFGSIRVELQDDGEDFGSVRVLVWRKNNGSIQVFGMVRFWSDTLVRIAEQLVSWYPARLMFRNKTP